MFAQGMIVLGLFGFILFILWKTIGKKLTNIFSEEYPESVEEKMNKLKTKVELARQLKLDLEASEKEVEVTKDINRLTNDILKYEEEVSSLENEKEREKEKIK